MESRDETKKRDEGPAGALRRLWTGRFPLLSLGLAIVWVASQLVVEIGFADRLDRVESKLDDSVEYFIEHPMLRIAPRMLPVLRDAMPGYEGNEVFSFLGKNARASKGHSLQEILDEKVRNAFGLLDSHPHRQLGIVPAFAKPYSYASYAFVHAGWLHMLASLLLLLMAGPLLERTFGRGAFAMMFLALGVGSAALYVYVLPGSDKPLVGGTVIAVGMVSAVITRFRSESVDFAEWLSPWLDVALRAPAWIAGIPAAAFVSSASLLAEGNLPQSIGVAPGYTAYAAAAMFGAGIAFAYSKNGVEKKIGDAPKPQPKVQPCAPQRLDMRRVERARETGDLDAAYSLLHAEAVRSPGNRSVVLAYWDLAVEVCRADEAVPIVFQLVREEMRRGAVEVAASHWCRVVEVTSGAHLEAKALVALLPWIQKSGGADKTLLALEHAMQRGDDGKDPLSPHVLADIAFTAADIAPDIADQAAQSALERGGAALEDAGLSEERRAEVEALRAKLAPKEREAPRFQTPNGELPESAFYAEQDRSEFAVNSGDLGGLLPDELGNMPSAVGTPAKFSSVKVAVAVPSALETEALALIVNGRDEARLAYSRICGVTIAGIGGLAPKPIVVVDLLLSVPDSDDLPLEVVRLRGDQFDPRRFVDGHASPLAALQSFAGQLLKRSGADAIPSTSILDPEAKILMFETEEEYHREILSVGS